MVYIIPAELEDLVFVQSIAHRTWPDTFGKVLSPAQIDYMLDWMYDVKHLEKQHKDGHQFFLADEDGEKLGFTGIEVDNEPGKTKIHKIYLLPSAQGKGVGKKLFAKIREVAKANDQKSLLLNVNKYNQGAIDFYEYLGFENIKSEVNDIGNGYVMDDFVFEMKL
ncbi:GNAT family N-acetyltransferase [Algoriphagus antarcticus]|uniref:L-amino acid N-acyltransferase YncA n=1 Tax=Algoriphagus antarcticus TaxID=238540 RepID=A0A3E0DPB8_9BACT|nr:GNAT family N-acetyltransferase [Algoriphagus antarcticus]REG84794.1 L-amino acid N-acyltransferase YncA [Algoriphagus antarcticus]